MSEPIEVKIKRDGFDWVNTAANVYSAAQLGAIKEQLQEQTFYAREAAISNQRSAEAEEQRAAIALLEQQYQATLRDTREELFKIGQLLPNVEPSYNGYLHCLCLKERCAALSTSNLFDYSDKERLTRLREEIAFRLDNLEANVLDEGDGPRLRAFSEYRRNRDAIERLHRAAVRLATVRRMEANELKPAKEALWNSGHAYRAGNERAIWVACISGIVLLVLLMLAVSAQSFYAPFMLPAGGPPIFAMIFALVYLKSPDRKALAQGAMAPFQADLDDVKERLAKVPNELKPGRADLNACQGQNLKTFFQVREYLIRNERRFLNIYRHLEQPSLRLPSADFSTDEDFELDLTALQSVTLTEEEYNATIRPMPRRDGISPEAVGQED